MQFRLSLQSFDYDSFQLDYHVQRFARGCVSAAGNISVNCCVHDNANDIEDAAGFNAETQEYIIRVDDVSIEAQITDALVPALINDDAEQWKRFCCIVTQRIAEALQRDDAPLFISVEC